MSGTDITTYPIHLGLGASARAQPEFTGAMEWYADYARRNESDGREGRLMALHTFSSSWDMWEMHPEGSEVVLCLSGTLTLHQETVNGAATRVELNAGEYAINEPGVWHTADVEGEATALFVTAGIGTQHRPR